MRPPRWRRGSAFAWHAGDRGSILGRDRPKSLKQVMTVSLSNARLYVSSIGNDHYSVPSSSVGQNVQSFISYGDVSKWVKNSRFWRKKPKQANKQWNKMVGLRYDNDRLIATAVRALYDWTTQHHIYFHNKTTLA